MTKSEYQINLEKHETKDVSDGDTSFIEFTLLPLDHKARIFNTILSHLR